MTTREIFNKLPDDAQRNFELLRKGYKNEEQSREKYRAALYGYTLGLRDSGLVSERERWNLYVYGTV